MGNFFSSSKSKQNERDIEELRRGVKTTTSNIYDKYQQPI